MAGKRAALALLALHVQPSAVALQRVLDDGQTESRTALPARTPRVHAVKSFGQARYMLGRYADAAVDDREISAFFVRPPAHPYRSLLVGVLHCVDQEVGEGGFDLLDRSVQTVAGIELQKHLARSLGAHQRVTMQTLQHARHVDGVARRLAV